MPHRRRTEPEHIPCTVTVEQMLAAKAKRAERGSRARRVLRELRKMRHVQAAK
jgi:hypothetical protein